ncbi:hypothetical protein TNCV_1822761, partial [Trichonephila clavipes]
GWTMHRYIGKHRCKRYIKEPVFYFYPERCISNQCSHKYHFDVAIHRRFDVEADFISMMFENRGRKTGFVSTRVCRETENRDEKSDFGVTWGMLETSLCTWSNVDEYPMIKVVLGGMKKMSVAHRTLECPVFSQLLPKKKSKSRAWEHFGLPANESGQIVSEDIAVCKLCGSPVSAKVKYI